MATQKLQDAEAYRTSAEQHLKAIKSSIRTFLIVGVFFIAGLAVAFALALAWFASNGKVQTDGMNLSADYPTIELRSHGVAGVHDDVLQNLLGTDGEKGFWYSLFATEGQHDTSRNMPAINWLLTDDSNLSNYNNGTTVDWTDENNKRIDYAIEPGASGHIRFSVVPKISGNIKVKCILELFPYTVTEQVFTEIPSDEFVANQIYGHILFYLDENQASGETLQWIKDKEFLLSIENAVADQEYEYTIYWSWPQTFGEIILLENDTYLNGKQPIYSNFSNGSEIRTEIVEDMTARPEKYFYSSLTRQPLNTEYTEITYMNQLHQSSTAAILQNNGDNAIQAFVDLSSYYNQADQYIGKNVDCVRVSLRAELDVME